jgi:serine/threonine protein kinase
MPQTLARLLDKQGEQLPWPVRLQIAIDLTSVFKFLVGKIFYRDLKSANILLDSDSRVVLADFGSATLDNKTYYQNHVGTPGWLAPEIMRGEKYTSAVDVFGLGRIFLHLLFPALSIKAQHLLSEEQILSKEKCPPGFAEICVACCREEPNERPNRDTVLSWLQMINDQKVEVKERFSLLLSPLSRFLEHFPGPDSSQKPGGFKNMVIPYEGLEFYSKRKEGDPAGKRYKVFLNNTTEGQLRLKWINSDRFAEFKHEVKILSWLRTTQAVGKLKRFGTDCQSEKDGAVRRSYFIVTEYTEQTLQTELKSKGSSWPSRLNIALNIAKNIKEIGEMHIVHRNINPNNIWLTLDLLAKLTDFDHAVINNETITDDKFATSDGVAPEKLASPAMDVFSFGRVMLDLLTQNPPSNIEDGPQHLLKLYLTCRYTNPAERLKIDDAISQLEATINPKPTLSLQENKPNSSSFLTGTTNLPQSKKISSSPEDSKHKDQLPKTPEVTSTNSMPPKKLPLHEKVELSIFGKIPSSKGSAKQLEKPPSQGCLVC